MPNFFFPGCGIGAAAATELFTAADEPQEARAAAVDEVRAAVEDLRASDAGDAADFVAAAGVGCDIIGVVLALQIRPFAIALWRCGADFACSSSHQLLHRVHLPQSLPVCGN